MMNTIEELGQRLKAEAMEQYDVRFPNPRFNEAMKTLHFLILTYAMRGNMDKVEVPVRFMQHICSLAVDGFEAASGNRYEHEKEALASLLDKLWYNFSGTLMRWVEAQRKQGSIPRELWYSCFQVPTWFIEAVEEDTKQRKALLR
jgi:hypothetical protein